MDSSQFYWLYLKWSGFSVNRCNDDHYWTLKGICPVSVDRAYVWERMREMGGAIIDFQGGHADALSNKPHKGLFACPLGRIDPDDKFWVMHFFFYLILQMQCMVCITVMHEMIY